MHKLIARMLRENNIGFTELNGTIPVKHRGELIRVHSEEPETDGISPQPGSESHHTKAPSAGALSEVETVMNSGMQFLAGMFKMATGKEISMADKAIEVDKTTGEVVMRFRIPV